MTNPTPHGQVPEALEDFEVRKLAAIGAVRTSSGLVERRPIEYRRELEDQFVRGFRAAEKRLSALSAAPTITPETGNATSAQGAAITSESGAAIQRYKICNHSYEWGSRSITTTSVTPDASGSWVRYADHVTALAAGQATKAAPTRTALPEGWTDCTIEFGNDGPEVVAYGPKRMMNRLAKWLGKYFAQVIADAAPKAAPGVGNSGFDHQTAADFLSGKTVSDEAVRKFVAASRWAHDERAALSATLLAMHGVLTSREAEIALLKKALLEAESAPQQEVQEPVATLHCNDIGYVWARATEVGTRMRFEQPINLYTAPQQEVQEPAPSAAVFGLRLVPVEPTDQMVQAAHHIDLSYMPGQEGADRAAIYRAMIAAAPQPAPDCHHRPQCNECAALAAQGGKA